MLKLCCRLSLKTHRTRIGTITRALGQEINLKLNNVPLDKYLKHLQDQYLYIKQNKGSTATENQRLLELQPVMDTLNRRRCLVDNIASLKDLLSDEDEEIRTLAEAEKCSYNEEISKVEEELLELLMPNDVDDYRNSIHVEVKAGVGGQEAMLFAAELFQMYCNFGGYKGWDVQVADCEITEGGGVRHASALIEGKNSFRYMKHEAGVHRVQRIPATEKAGRIHTSTASVLVLPQPTEIEVQLNNNDLKIETKRASGAGGQHVNTTDSAVRIVHLPTGTAVDCQVDRSQAKNRKIAMQKLRALLYQKQLDEQMSETQAMKKSQVRSSFRNEKIRTYNYGQDRITDHRLQSSNVHNLREFFTGRNSLESLIVKVDNALRIEQLLQNVRNLK